MKNNEHTDNDYLTVIYHKEGHLSVESDIEDITPEMYCSLIENFIIYVSAATRIRKKQHAKTL